jgi:ATP-dependent Clp protease adaptor protein ClpS
MPTEVQEETLTLEEILAGLKEMHRLILWNDDHNTFDHVIHCMMKYLDYSESQSEKIAWKVHNEGKCAVLEGSTPRWRSTAKYYSRRGSPLAWINFYHP